MLIKNVYRENKLYKETRPKKKQLSKGSLKYTVVKFSIYVF